MSSRDNASSVDPSAIAINRPSSRVRLATGLGLFIIVLGVYLATLSPGVGHGDIAELQWVAPQLGICHPPGYPLIVCAGWLVAHIPLGPSIAWRLNLFTAICAAVACVLLYDALARITQRVVPAVVGAATLAFSAIFWMHALESEVYAFYALLLLGGIYCGVRFFLAGRVAWFMAAALLLGACVSNRVSEVFVLPALPLAWLAFRHTARLTVGRLALAAVLFLLPSGFTLGFYLLRQDPNALYLRDNLLRDKIIEPQSRPFSELSAWEKLQDAVSYSLALKWQHVVVGDQRAELVQLPWQLDKLGWLLSGAGAIQDRFPTETEENRWRKLEQTPGASSACRDFCSTRASPRDSLAARLGAGSCWAARPSRRGRIRVLSLSPSARQSRIHHSAARRPLAARRPRSRRAATIERVTLHHVSSAALDRAAGSNFIVGR